MTWKAILHQVVAYYRCFNDVVSDDLAHIYDHHTRTVGFVSLPSRCNAGAKQLAIGVKCPLSPTSLHSDLNDLSWLKYSDCDEAGCTSRQNTVANQLRVGIVN